MSVMEAGTSLFPKQTVGPIFQAALATGYYVGFFFFLKVGREGGAFAWVLRCTSEYW